MDKNNNILISGGLIRGRLPLLSCALVAGLLAACHPDPGKAESDQPGAAPASPVAAAPDPSAALVASMAFRPVANPGPLPAAATPAMQAQVVLDRLGFSPGVIDGKPGASFKKALAGFQSANDIAATGELDDATRQALARWQQVAPAVLVTVPKAFVTQKFYPDLPTSESGMAKFDNLGYRTMAEALAERFHTTPETLIALNGAQAMIAAGKPLWVPNIPDVKPEGFEKDARDWNETLVSLGVSPRQAKADHLVVDKSDGVLRVFDKQDRLIGQFPVTTGSEHDPLPIGTWTIQGEARNPDYQFNPKLFWDASKNAKAARLPPGPNGPVGVVWMDLSKPHYGIHGTPEPQNIGHTESHGCVRLTNWDAARVAEMVSAGTKVVFQP
ncbi:L,D-transpeptidase [Novosphingobium sp. 9]|uniref:L,D-transpeptidase family protein n=1 Tax=Novosphingobium sp. 9 TaxID=2025349 RepID=UPI0021B6AEE9|nr:L,D-transpeptidase family protein [Novosphingobium sp. 9]